MFIGELQLSITSGLMPADSAATRVIVLKLEPGCLRAVVARLNWFVE